MSLDLEIADALASDAFAIAILARDLVERGMDWTWTPDHVSQYVTSPSARVAVARTQDEIVASGIMYYASKHAHLLLLLVTAPSQRRGIGSDVLQWLEAPVYEAGLSRVLVETRSDNQSARAFYKRNGFYEIGAASCMYTGGIGRTRLEKIISNSGGCDA